jgi:serine/threonine-protein kinase
MTAGLTERLTERLTARLTGRFVLPTDVTLVPADALGAEARSQVARVGLGDGAAGVVVTRPHRRAATHLIDGDSAALLERFRTPMTIRDAVLAASRVGSRDPEGLLRAAWPMLRTVMSAGLLVMEDDAAAVAPTVGESARVEGWTTVRGVQMLADAEVWQVRAAPDHPSAPRHAALKLVRSASEADAARLAHEATVLDLLDGVGVPRLLARGTTGSSDYLILTWCPGVTVETAAAEYRAWPGVASRPALARLLLAIADAYAALHTQGVLHGDVHPHNVLVDADGSVRLVDFGYAYAQARLPALDAPPRAGVASYFEPECAAAAVAGAPYPPVTAAGEQFAVAALLYRLATGAAPTDLPIERDAFWRALAVARPRSFEAVGVAPWPAVEVVLARALAGDPAARYPSMAAAAAALRSAIAASDVPEIVPTVETATAVVGRAGAGARVSQGDRGTATTRAVLDRVLRRAEADVVDGRVRGLGGGSVMYGGAGTAYLLARVAAARSDARWWALADVWAEHARVAATDPLRRYRDAWGVTPATCRPESPYHMPAGAHVVRALIADAVDDAETRLDAVDALVDQTASTDAPDDAPDPDLTLGSAGVLLAAAALVPLVDETDVERRARLLARGRVVSQGLWLRRAGLDAGGARRVPATTGVAHGRAGLLLAILLWSEASGDAVPPGIADELTALAAYGEPIGRGIRWPWSLDAESDGRATYVPGWCNGTAGLVHLWLAAARWSPGDGWLEWAERAGWHSWEESASAGSTLCCGDAGIAYAMLALERATGDAAWGRRASALADRAARAIERSHADERGAPSVAAHETLADSLFRGDVGVALVAADLDSTSPVMPFLGFLR